MSENLLKRGSRSEDKKLIYFYTIFFISTTLGKISKLSEFRKKMATIQSIIGSEDKSSSLNESLLPSAIKKTPSKEEIQEIGHVIKMIAFALVVAVCCPIIICDLYYGYSKDSCLSEYPEKLNISMKDYLLISGYYSIAGVVHTFLIVNTTTFKEPNPEIKNVALFMNKTFKFIAIIFTMALNIVGGILFWGHLYKDQTCDKDTNTYIFVTLIIKLSACFLAIFL
jgi:hypothetical protein